MAEAASLRAERAQGRRKFGEAILKSLDEKKPQVQALSPAA